MEKMNFLNDYLRKILSAKIYDVVKETPLETAKILSTKLENNILIKREDLQDVFSFKIRGAYNKILNLSEEEKSRGIIAASAGNHAQGVALSATKLGIDAVIVMPRTTPTIKVEAVKSRGAKVILFGDNFDEAQTHAKELEKAKGFTFVHPYDDEFVIAGQGTIAMEILRQHSGNIDAIFVPVGGGGLIAGIAVYVKYLRPEIKIVGVEAEDSACLKNAMEKKDRVKLSQVGIFADGIAVGQIGEETFKICREFVDEVITVNSDEICAAIKDLFVDCRAIYEPAGAASIAGIKKYVSNNECKGQTFVGICSGANLNFDRLRYIAERTEAGEHREILLGVTIPEKAGSFKKFCHAIGGHDISEFNYRYADKKDAKIFVGIKLKSEDDTKEKMISRLNEKGYNVVDLSDNELAKLHIRHTVGGRVSKLQDERIYRFEFPERPEALMNFLDKIQDRWNCSLFHYRNHGAAFGRVMMGLQIPQNEIEKVTQILGDLGYEFWDETENIAYKEFLL